MPRFTDQFLDELRERVPVSAIAGRKVELKRRGAEWVGFSPFNKEDTASFTVNDDKGFWHDFSSGKHGDVFGFLQDAEGLDFPEAVEEVARVAGIPLPAINGHDDHAQRPLDRHDGTEPGGTTRDDGAGEHGGDAAAHGANNDRRIGRTYDYTDAQGGLIYQVCRIEWTGDDGKPRKTFIQRRPTPDNDGEWIWGLTAGDYLHSRYGDWYQVTKERAAKWVGAERRAFGGTEHGLYRLVEFNELASADEPAFITEGEKDADTLRAWDLVATTNSGGAANWRPDHAERFRGLDVVILMDNDDAGRKRADKIGASLQGVTRRVRVLNVADYWPKEVPWPAGHEGGKGIDVTDWRDENPVQATRENLLAMVAQSPDWRPPPFKSQFGALAWEHLDDPGPEHQFMIDGWLTVGDKSIIGGPSRSGKSFLAIHAGASTARGVDFFGNKVMTPGLVIYQAGEGARGVKKRIRAYRKHFGVGASERVPFVLLQSKIDLYNSDGDTQALIDEIQEIAKLYTVPLRAIFIDTLATATGGADENSGRDMSTVMANVDRINAATGAHVCLVHHMNAAGTKLRGHTSVYANVDQVITVTRDEVTKIRTAVLDKQKDGEDGTQIRFELFQVEVGTRFDGKPETSCVTLEVGEKDAARKAEGNRGFKLTQQEELVFRALVNALAEKGQAPPTGFKIPEGVSVITYAEWREAYARSAPIDHDDERKRKETIKKAMTRAGTTLLKFGIIGRDDPYVWWTGLPVRGFARQAGQPLDFSKLKPPAQAPDDGDDIVF